MPPDTKPELAVELRKQYPERCDRCGWPLKERIEDGCVRDNCSERPLQKPRETFHRSEYLATRAERDAAIDSRAQALELLREALGDLKHEGIHDRVRAFLERNK